MRLPVRIGLPVLLAAHLKDGLPIPHTKLNHIDLTRFHRRMYGSHSG